MHYAPRDSILTEMADWFLDPSVTDEQELTAALASIPDANTWFHLRSLLIARYKAIPFTARTQPLDRKWELVDAERSRRNQP